MAGIATGQLVSFSIGVDVSAPENAFSDIEVFRSRSGPEGPYEELTGTSWSPAQLSAFAKSVNVNGKQLLLQVNEKNNITITFAGSDPMAPSAIATQITTQGLGLVTSYVDGSDLFIQTFQPGLAAVLRVLGGDAAALLGFTSLEPLAVAFGLDARIPIVPTVSSYRFQDPNGDPTYNYKVRFSNEALNTVSEFSAPFTVSDQSPIDQSLMATGSVTLIGLDGSPSPDVEVRIQLVGSNQLVDGALVTGGYLVGRTDDTGYVEFNLPRGTEVTVAITGTNIIRDVTVPDVDTFNLLDPTIGQDDAFAVQRPDIPYAVRRAL